MFGIREWHKNYSRDNHGRELEKTLLLARYACAESESATKMCEHTSSSCEYSVRSRTLILRIAAILFFDIVS